MTVVLLLIALGSPDDPPLKARRCRTSRINAEEDVMLANKNAIAPRDTDISFILFARVSSRPTSESGGRG
jgi:hypothetical protein